MLQLSYMLVICNICCNEFVMCGFCVSFFQVALHFVKDEKTRFGLALECGNIEVG